MIDAGVEDVQPFKPGRLARRRKKLLREFREHVAAEIGDLGARGDSVVDARLGVVRQHQQIELDAVALGGGSEILAEPGVEAMRNQ